MARKYLSNGEKLTILQDLDLRTAQGESLKSVARSYGLDPSQIRKWRAKRLELTQTKTKAKTLGKGRPSSIKHLEDRIVGWALDMRARGVPLKYRELQVRAARLDPNFAELTMSKQYHQIRRLCAANCLVLREKTHTAQRHPDDEVEQALGWLVVVRPILAAANINQRFVMNMDQVPVCLSMHPNRTLNLQGARTVPVRCTSNSTSRFTASLTVCADGSKLKPFCIFKGAKNGRIATREFPTNPVREQLTLVCQECAWQDEENMLQWIDATLVPHLQEKAGGVQAVLFLDSFSAHWTDTVKARMEELEIQVHQVPGGCTGLVQPIDVGIGKPFKDRLRRKWFDWLVQGGVDRAVFERPSREIATTWVAEAWESLPQDVVRSSWRKTDLSYFP